jgi:hypothetical protein
VIMYTYDHWFYLHLLQIAFKINIWWFFNVFSKIKYYPPYELALPVLEQSHVRDKKASCVKEYLDTEFKKSLENSHSQKNLKEVQGAWE